MIDVAVGEQDLFEARARRPQSRVDLIQITAWVDHRGQVGGLIDQD